MVRAVLLAMLLTACAHRAPAGPAWPTPHREDDGGESLAPHVARTGSGAPTTGASDAKADADHDSATASADSDATDDSATDADDDSDATSSSAADDATIEIDDDGQ